MRVGCFNSSVGSMDDIIDKLSSSDPRFTHLDLREINMQTKNDLITIADKLENNTVVIRVSWREEYRYDAILKKQIEDKVNLNNKTFQRHPNDFIFGLLSCHAYTDSKTDASVEFSSLGVANIDERNEELRKWNVFKVFDKPESGRYYSVAYINKEKKQIVLAHRGTKLKLSDLFKNESPLKTDLEGILGGKIDKQEKEAYGATEKVITHAKKEGYNVSFTGHSLGAWLAELSLYYAVYNFKYSKGKAVTFDSPGSASTMKSYKPNVKKYGSDPIIENLDITSYLSGPNLVNCCNPHIGKVYRIFPDLPSNKITEWLRSTDVKNVKRIPKAKRLWPVLMGLLSLDGHRMEPIIATFNSETGKPEILKLVLDWPCFRYHPKTTSRTLGRIKQNLLSGIMPLCKNLPGIGWLAYEVFSKTTLYTVLKSFYNLANGKIDMHQFTKNLECSNFISEDKVEKGAILLTSEEQFILKYEVHYSTRELKPVIDYYNSKSNDWYLNKLCKLGNKEIDRMNIVHDLKEKLKQLKAQYKIKFEAGTKYICVKSPEVEVDTLREKIERLCETYEELAEMFDDKYAFYPQLTKPGVISCNLPLSSIFFLKRPNVTKKIDKALNEHRVVAISGPSGTGKTTIAVEYGRDSIEKFSGQIVRIIQADSPKKITEAYKKMIAEVDLGMNFQDEAANIMPLLHRKIAEFKSSVLFIFDNVESYDNVEAYLEEISTIENIQVIITTRLNDLNKYVPNINLNPFTKEEAKLYLQKTITSQSNEHIIDHLINNLRGEAFMLPSIISDAVACFKRKILCSVPRNIGDLRENLLNFSELSWYVLQYSAYLDPDFISLDIFKELLSVDEDELQVAIKEVERLGLANLERQNGERGLTLHRSIQDLVKTYADKNKHLKSVIDTHNIQLGINKALSSLLKKDVNQCEDLKLFFLHARQFFSVVISNNSHLIRRQYLMERDLHDLRKFCDQHIDG